MSKIYPSNLSDAEWDCQQRFLPQCLLQVTPGLAFKPHQFDHVPLLKLLKRLVEASFLSLDIQQGLVPGARNHSQDAERRLDLESLKRLGTLYVAHQRENG
jgi:hypothetical protein